jgi:L-asparaginase II
MTAPALLTEIWRGPILESLHHGHAVICDAGGDIVEAWGDPKAVVLPRVRQDGAGAAAGGKRGGG